VGSAVRRRACSDRKLHEVQRHTVNKTPKTTAALRSSLVRYDVLMLAKERQQLLIDEVNRAGRVVTSEFAAKLGVSDVTIRADLDELERRGRVTRSHGGAVTVDGTSNSAIVGFDLRMSMQREAKRRIAVAAAAYLQSNQTVIFDAGTTVHHLASTMPPVTNLTVYTPGISVAQQLLGAEGVEMHLLGGRVDPRWLETVGTPREQGIEDLMAHTLFLGAHGIDSDLDIVDLSQTLAQNKLQLTRHARTIVLMIDSTKWARSGSSKVMPLDRVDVIVTDGTVPKELRKRVDKLDVELLVV